MEGVPYANIHDRDHLPVYRQRSYDAATVAEACHNAVADDDWSGERHDFEAAGETYVTGIWSGADTAYRGEPVLVPSQLCGMVERKADHFDVLLALLKQPVQATGPSAVAFARWLPLAQAAVAKAEAILAGLRDPS